MSFYEKYLGFKEIDIFDYFDKVTREEVLKVINKDKLDELDFLKLLSPAAEEVIEIMAQKAHTLSICHFGKTVQLYTPLYISNFCVNRCVYCSYNADNMIVRRKLSTEEIESEAIEISKTGLKHILLLTGESRKETPLSYIVDAVGILKKYFDSVSIEIYPMDEVEYKQIVDAGADGLTIYQEVYDEAIYDKVHISGPKKNYRFRLNAPESGCKAKFRSVNIGALFGLNDWRIEAFYSGLHAYYLQNKYPEVEIGLSLPRIRPHIGMFNEIHHVSDKNLVQILLAYRIFLPRSGINISTRERQELRDNLIPLGVTKMSAGVSTEVGGHTSKNSGSSQFEIYDKRSVEEIKIKIKSLGYQPVLKDWLNF